MDQEKKRAAQEEQVLYLGRWVERKSFRTFVYKTSEQKLVKSFDEYALHLASGEWFESPEALKLEKQEVKPEISREIVEKAGEIPEISTLDEKKSPVSRISDFREKAKPKPKVKAEV